MGNFPTPAHKKLFVLMPHIVCGTTIECNPPSSLLKELGEPVEAAITRWAGAALWRKADSLG